MRFAYTTVPAGGRPLDQLPYLPIRLRHRQKVVDEMALLDTGATINLLPLGLGVQLGFDWNAVNTLVPLSGNLAKWPAKAIKVLGTIGPYPPVSLTFAWSQSNDVPLILGNFNFMFEFDACFFRSRGEFEVQPRA
jgi:hypothetical protein